MEGGRVQRTEREGEREFPQRSTTTSAEMLVVRTRAESLICGGNERGRSGESGHGGGCVRAVIEFTTCKIGVEDAK